jgi:hypothetical protein
MKKNFSAHFERTDLINMSSEKKHSSRETVPLNERKSGHFLNSVFLFLEGVSPTDGQQEHNTQRRPSQLFLNSRYLTLSLI